MAQSSYIFNAENTTGTKLNYLLHIPDNYDNTKKWPLIMFIHGVGECGDDIEKVKVHGIPKLVIEDTNFPFIAISPQFPECDFSGDLMNALKALIDYVIDTYSVDETRIYLTGLSMGGEITWYLASRFTDTFAAILPICGGSYYTEFVPKLKDIPVWTFHGDKDDIVPIEHTQKMVDLLKEAGGNVKFTIIPDGGHIIWEDIYNNPETYSWLLSHTKE